MITDDFSVTKYPASSGRGAQLHTIGCCKSLCTLYPVCTLCNLSSQTCVQVGPARDVAWDQVRAVVVSDTSACILPPQHFTGLSDATCWYAYSGEHAVDVFLGWVRYYAMSQPRTFKQELNRLGTNGTASPQDICSSMLQ